MINGCILHVTIAVAVVVIHGEGDDVDNDSEVSDATVDE